MFSLIKNDFQRQFLGSYFGIAWAFVQPLAMVFVLWVVFEFGLRASHQSSDIPFVIWLMTGMLPWFFFAGSMSTGVHALTSNAFLVKKIAFNVDVLPLVKVSSALIIHTVLLAVLLLIYLSHGLGPVLHWLQLPYYLICSFFLLIGLTSITSSIYVFVRDIGNVVTIVLQMGFWLTPIFWSYERVPEKYQWLMQLNPIFYIVKGYRDSLMGRSWFWENASNSLIFYFELGIILLIGVLVYSKLRIHFGDVL